MKCPVCNNVNLVMSERQGVEIDYCPECRGVWLDRGELDKILERSKLQQPPGHTQQYAAQPAPPPQHGYQGGHAPHDHGHGHKHHRKKSFLEELFD